MRNRFNDPDVYFVEQEEEHKRYVFEEVIPSIVGDKEKLEEMLQDIEDFRDYYKDIVDANVCIEEAIDNLVDSVSAEVMGVEEKLEEYRNG